jgi:hypothetical protein
LSATELNNAEFDKSVLNNLELLKTFVDQLNTGSRRERQSAALVLAGAAQEAPEALLPYKEDLLDALNRPEAQTRWEVLDALSQIVKVDSAFGEEALEGAETALFDETSGPLRLSAVKFLCSFGALSPENSKLVWPLLDEGIQCYHGDIEFQDMLSAIDEFVLGDVDQSVKDSLIARMRFDAENGKGAVKRHAMQIVENASK